MSAAELDRVVGLLVGQVGHWQQPRWAAVAAGGNVSRADLVHKLVQHAPTRLLWGSDWPHPQYFKPMPNDVALLDMMLDWVPDEKTRKLIFVDNPAEAFGFPPVT